MPSRKWGLPPSRSGRGQKNTYRPRVNVSDAAIDLPPSSAAVTTRLRWSTSWLLAGGLQPVLDGGQGRIGRSLELEQRDEVDRALALADEAEAVGSPSQAGEPPGVAVVARLQAGDAGGVRGHPARPAA